MNVENIAERRGSSVPGMTSSPSAEGSDNIVPKGAVRARDCSALVSDFISLMMHPTTVGDPSKARASSGSASYVSVKASSRLGDVGCSSS